MQEPVSPHSDFESSGGGSLQAYAHGLNIDTGEVVQRQLADESDVERAVKQFQAELPEVDSAYVPSGILPAEAMFWMILGTILGVPVGMLGAIVVLAVGGVICGLLVGLTVLLAACVIWIGAIFLLAIVAFVTVVGQYVAAGICSGYVVARMSQLGKNRNVGMTSVMAAISAVAAVYLITLPLLMPDPWLPHLAQLGINRNDIPGPWAYWTLATIGAAIAGFVGILTAAGCIGTRKFCEACELWMTVRELRKLPLGALRLVPHVVKERHFTRLAQIYREFKGRDSQSFLFYCPSCGIGYFDAEFEAEFKYDEDDEDYQQWLVASCSLEPDDVRILETAIES